MWEAATAFTRANQLLLEEEGVAAGLEMLMILLCIVKRTSEAQNYYSGA